ncbi:helix-turn-helix domain-containing protein [Stutzerimonas nitrititolerans]|uniref:helix-turn-helix domain-containing protein n=1 Tax=Stutzerimonas nitrititolerans TaxID=2482751 RepID=UPI0028A9CFFB|nr:helix-turn-helix domain-containing protein [Stutzerimonas nitrititolerans]
MDTIQIDGWQGRLGQGLAPRQLLATLYAAKDMTAKQIAKHMDCSPSTINKQLESARYNLSEHPNYIRTIRGLCLEAMKRGIIAPLVLLLCIATGIGTIDHNVRRPVRAPKVAVRYVARQEVA